MLELIVIALPFAVGGSVGYLVYRVAIRRIEQIKQQFQILADTLNLEYHMPDKSFWGFNKSFPSAEGIIDNKRLYIYMYTEGSGKNQRTYSAFRINTINRYSYTFGIYKEGFFSKVGKKLGMQDIKIGEEQFDENFMVKSNDDYFVKSLLDEALMSHFLQVFDMMNGEFSLKQDEITYSEIAYLITKKKRQNFEQLIYLGSAISDAVTKFSESHKPPGL